MKSSSCPDLRRQPGLGSAPLLARLGFFGRTSGDFGWMRRRLKKLKRLMQKWVRRPPPIRVQATYGVAAAGILDHLQDRHSWIFSSNPAWKKVRPS